MKALAKVRGEACFASAVLFLCLRIQSVSGILISTRTLEGCDFEVLTMDDRPLPHSVFSMGEQRYWALAAALNAAYAAHWSYKFTYVKLNSSAMPGYHPAWAKVFYLSERIRQATETGQCRWFLFLDSDAYVREYDVPLDIFLAALGKQYRIRADVGAIFAREEDPDIEHLGVSIPGLREYYQNYRFEAAWLNSGVLLAQSGAKGQQLFEAWEQAAREAGSALRSRLPADTAVLTEMINPGLYPLARTTAQRPMPGNDGQQQPINRTVAVVHMVVMNSPWGRFAAHAWSYHQSFRESMFWDGLLRIQIAGLEALGKELHRVHKYCLVRWKPKVETLGGTWW